MSKVEYVKSLLFNRIKNIDLQQILEKYYETMNFEEIKDL